MIVSSDPALWVAVALLLLVGVLTVRLRRARRARAVYARRLAVVTGHPAAGMGTRNDAQDRRALADAAAQHLAEMGMVAERRSAAPIVRARGRAGEYVLTVSRGRIVVVYETVVDQLELGEFASVPRAVREIAAHADLPAPV